MRLEAGVGSGPGGAKRYRLATHRVLEPAETLARIERHLDAAGITRIANVTGLDRIGIPVALAVRPNARSVAVAQGKGADLDAAKASAVMESLETWHAERVEAPLLRARPGDMDRLGHPTADLERLARASIHDPHDEELFWIEGADIASGARAWLPLECVSADFTLPALPGSGLFVASTNGLASGNSRDEALAHALSEVIERDAESLWRAGGARARAERGVDPASVDDALCQELMQRFSRAGVALKLWDLTSDVGVACFCCLAIDEAGDWADPELGAGCHPDRGVALARALTEAAQARVTFISGSRDDLGDALYRPAARAERRRRCIRMATEHSPRQAFETVPTRSHGDVGEDVRWLLERLEVAGMTRAIAVDLAREAVGVPVVRVVVPGLEGPSEHLHCDYLPGARARRIIEGRR